VLPAAEAYGPTAVTIDRFDNTDDHPVRAGNTAQPIRRWKQRMI
jgi:hypothetical protein